MARVLNFAAFQLGWFACVLSAARGQAWIGALVVLALLVAHMLRFRGRRASEARLILAAGIVGLIADTLAKACGALEGAGPSWLPMLAPAWLLPLWLIFATTLNGSMFWMADRWVIAVVFGAVGGPLSYWAGLRMGALTLGTPLWQSFAWIALEWAIAMPVLLWLRARITGPRN